MKKRTGGQGKAAGGGAPETPDAGVTRVLLCCEGCDPVAFGGRPRDFHAPIHVSNGIRAFRLAVETIDPRAEVAVDGVPLDGGRMREPRELACGRNAFVVTVTASDGRTRRELHLRVLRDYASPAWERVAETTPWMPRDSAGELVFRDRMWLLGGYTPEMARDVWSSADGMAWAHESDVPTPRGIDIPVAFVFGDRMWVADVAGVLYSSPDGRTWSVATSETPWRGRGSAGCAVFQDRIWVMGGSRPGELLNDVWSSRDGVRWTLETPHAAWSGRQITHAPVVLNGRMWLLGGGALGSDYHPFVAWNDVWSSADGVNWEPVLPHAPWCPRIWGSSAVYRDRLWLLGGFRSEPTWENLGDAWYSTDGVDWRRLECPPAIRHSGGGNEAFASASGVWAPRHEQSVYAHAGALWVVGGMVWPLVNDVWRLAIPGLCFVSQPVIETYVQARYEYAACADFGPAGKRMRYRLRQAPDWLSIDPDTGVLGGTAQEPGDAPIHVEASVAGGETARQDFVLHVLPYR
jgi:hypothetical protein